MTLLRVLGEAMAATLGSLAAAALLGWVAWKALKLFRHPELGMPIILAVALGLFSRPIFASEFLRMTLTMSVVLGIALWIAGRDWRRTRSGPGDP
jgi:hypothetical protein